MRVAHNPSTWGGRILSSALNAGDYLIKHGFNRDIQPLNHAIPAICLFDLHQSTGRTDFLHSAQEMAVRCVESVEMGGVAPNGVYGQMLAKAYETPKRDRFVERASLLAQSILGDQKSDGSWAGRLFPDSQWIVFLIKLYERTKSEEFLKASKRCADWLLKSGIPRAMGRCLKGTAASTVALLELHSVSPNEKYRESCKEAISWYVSVQGTDGHYMGGLDDMTMNDLDQAQSDTIRSLAMLLKIEREKRYLESLKAATAWVIARQRDDGSWDSIAAKPLTPFEATGHMVRALAETYRL